MFVSERLTRNMGPKPVSHGVSEGLGVSASLQILKGSFFTRHV